MPKKPVKRHHVVQPLDKPYRLIPLTQGQNAIVDAEDFEWLSEFNWHALWCPATKSFYARTKIAGRHRSMHNQIIPCEADGQIDHINHDTIDNRRANLRKVAREQNQWNARKRTGQRFKGVSWHTGKWVARVTAHGVTVPLGRFESAEEAAHAYDDASKELHGEFAYLNFP